ncbi:hypothetical protein DL96DRAFT_69536 [Flagelloscypha sp. PMI_526]|nr:hypothetical protein DL96DRAFT_69536 [Flagelloscypha sp. PMI_526]
MTYPSSAHASPWQPIGHTPTSTPAQYPAAFGIAHSSSAPAGQQQWMTGQFGEELITPPDSPHIGFGNPGPAFGGGGEPIIAGGFGPSPAHQGAFPTVGLPIANDERLSRSRSERRRRRSGEMAYAPARSKSRHRSEEFPHITRSLSYGGGQQVYQNFRSASQSKKIPRPRDWRANYKTSPLAFLNPTSNSKTFSIVQGYTFQNNSFF